VAAVEHAASARSEEQASRHHDTQDVRGRVSTMRDAPASTARAAGQGSGKSRAQLSSRGATSNARHHPPRRAAARHKFSMRAAPFAVGSMPGVRFRPLEFQPPPPAPAGVTLNPDGASRRPDYHNGQDSGGARGSHHAGRTRRRQLRLRRRGVCSFNRNLTPGITRPRPTLEVFNLADGILAGAGRVHAVVRRQPLATQLYTSPRLISAIYKTSR